MVERSETVRLNRGGYRAWLADPATTATLAAYHGLDEPPELVLDQLVDSLKGHRALKQPETQPQWRDDAEDVILATLAGLPWVTSDELRGIYQTL